MTNYVVGDIVLIALPHSKGLPPKRRPAVVMLDIGDAVWSSRLSQLGNAPVCGDN